MPRVADDVIQEYAGRLAELRRATGRTQGQVAALVGVPKNTYCRWEQGLRWPAVRFLRPLAAALGAELPTIVP